MGLVTATKAFCKLLFNAELSQSFQQILDGTNPPKIEQAAPPVAHSQPQTAARSEALSLLAALQREARLLDLVNESLDNYSDAQVGAAARDVLRDSGKVLERMFDFQPLTGADDGSTVTTPDKFDATEYRLTGNVNGEAPFTGILAHHGWKAERCEVPKWSGAKQSSMVVAPIELEIS